MFACPLDQFRAGEARPVFRTLDALVDPDRDRPSGDLVQKGDVVPGGDPSRIIRDVDQLGFPQASASPLRGGQDRSEGS